VTERTLAAVLRRTAHASPDTVAVVDGDRTVSYAQLDEDSDAIAASLLGLGARPGDRIGLYLDKSYEAITGIYGIMKTGAAYVPLDPSAPAERLRHIASDCGMTILISAPTKEETWPALTNDGGPIDNIVVPNGEPAGQLEGAAVHGASAIAGARPATAPDVSEGDLAYILYTSGSTGGPKGVMLTHKNCLAFVEWAVSRFDVSANDRVSSHAPFHFDLSTFDLFAAAVAGACVVLVPPSLSMWPVELRRFIESTGITVWYSVPSALTMLSLRGGVGPETCPDLRQILFAGEVFPTKFLRRLMEQLPHVRMANLYGPTETNVCTFYEVEETPATDEPIPIGRPIDDTEILLLDDDLGPVEAGDVGEMYVRGPTVMRGYWAGEETTNASLIDPDGRGLTYKTGDLARVDAHGDLRFLGRRDAQIKSRGYRIELGEIESRLNSHPDVVESAVSPVPDELATNLIRADVVGEVDEATLRRFLAEALPQYMIPDRFVFARSLPKTSTGKIDRQRLLEDSERKPFGER
jgi:amino acid adenylation domain-containing protein